LTLVHEALWIAKSQCGSRWVGFAAHPQTCGTVDAIASVCRACL